MSNSIENLDRLTPQEKAELINHAVVCLDRAKADHEPQHILNLMEEYLNWVRAEL